jgi:hypothetical protein
MAGGLYNAAVMPILVDPNNSESLHPPVALEGRKKGAEKRGRKKGAEKRGQYFIFAHNIFI